MKQIVVDTYEQVCPDIEAAQKLIDSFKELSEWGSHFWHEAVEIVLGREYDDPEGYCPDYVIVRWKHSHVNYSISHTTEKE